MKFDLTGQKFNRLTVISKSEKRNNNREVYWCCICECGNTTEVTSCHLRKEYIRSCGCLQIEKVKDRSSTLKQNNPEMYSKWVSMKSRCDNENDNSHVNYGARGITYDIQWQQFDNFFNDMNVGFSVGLELDRVDVNGNYEKSNCRWVDHSENNFNKRRQSNNTSGKTGVNLMKTGKYRAYIVKDKKQIHIGVFDTFEQALLERKQKELEIYGYNRD